MIRVLIVEDSETTARLFRLAFQAAPDMDVVGVAKNGLEAVRMANSLKPDIITMDIRMPEMNGFEATRKIMSTNPIPIIVVSASLENEDLKVTFQAVEAGALAVIEKPEGFDNPGFSGGFKEMVNLVRVMSSVRVKKRKPKEQESAYNTLPDEYEPESILPAAGDCKLVAIGCSMGGPQALQVILPGLPADFPVPIIITQHISTGFLDGLVAWLGESSGIKVKQAENNEHLLAGHIYLAPDKHHLLVKRDLGGFKAVLDTSKPVNGFRPSASVMLDSVADTCPGQAVGVILSGIGVDGASGLLKMRETGCKTIVQDRASAVIYGMPGAALELDAAELVEKLENIAATLVRLTTV